MNAPDLDPESIPCLSAAEVEFRREVIYFIVLDRFYDGCPGNLDESNELNDVTQTDWDKYWGGDLQGVLDKLDYLQETGVTAIWLTPLFEQVEGLEDGKKRAPIHGYWAKDFKRINTRWLNDPHEASLFRCKDTLFDRFLAELHKRGMKFVMDVICNHSSPKTNEGKGKLYDDGKLIADYENDTEHWYHHYGGVRDWQDEWQLQNREVGGLATFNENNILFRNYIKEAIKLWLKRGVDALRVDTFKHMPLWFWQEFITDMHSCKPGTFVFGEWINSHPDNERSVEYGNEDGMNILDFGLCHVVRDCLGKRSEAGFKEVQAVLDKDSVYRSATEMVTFFENHDMPRFQTLNAEREWMHLALVLILTARGIPCLYYGCEQYLHCDLEGGDDPYNRPMMKDWGPTDARRLTRILGEERRSSPSIQWGGMWPKVVTPDVYVFLRRYRDSRCLVVLNRGAKQEIDLNDCEFPDGSYHCLLSDVTITIKKGASKLISQGLDAFVFSIRGSFCDAKIVVHVQVNGVPTQPGERVAIFGDLPEMGAWDLQRLHYLECINANTWFGEIAFQESEGQALAYKYVIVKGDDLAGAERENRAPRRRVLCSEGVSKWRDCWEGD